jgi:hypothetical protein
MSELPRQLPDAVRVPASDQSGGTATATLVSPDHTTEEVASRGDSDLPELSGDLEGSAAADTATDPPERSTAETPASAADDAAVETVARASDEDIAELLDQQAKVGEQAGPLVVGTEGTIVVSDTSDHDTRPADATHEAVVPAVNEAADAKADPGSGSDDGPPEPPIPPRGPGDSDTPGENPGEEEPDDARKNAEASEPVEETDAENDLSFEEEDDEAVTFEDIVEELAQGGNAFTLQELQDTLDDYNVGMDEAAARRAFDAAQVAIVQRYSGTETPLRWNLLGEEVGFSVPRYVLLPGRVYVEEPPVSEEAPVTLTSTDVPGRQVSEEIAQPTTISPASPGLYAETAARPEGPLPVASVFRNEAVQQTGMRDRDIIDSYSKLRRPDGAQFGEEAARATFEAARASGALEKVKGAKGRTLWRPAAEQPVTPAAEVTVPTLPVIERPARQEITVDTAALRTAVVANQMQRSELRARSLRQLFAAVGAGIPEPAFKQVVRQMEKDGILSINKRPGKGASFKSPGVRFSAWAVAAVADARTGKADTESILAKLDELRVGEQSQE